MLRIDQTKAAAKSRIALIHLGDFSLNLISNWRDRLPDIESMLIVLAVLVIRGGRLTRAAIAEDHADLATRVPPDMLGRCNIASVAFATGLNRETVRRRAKRLIEQNLLMYEEDGSLGLASGLLQLPVSKEITQKQLRLLARCANALLREGMLEHKADES